VSFLFLKTKYKTKQKQNRKRVGWLASFLVGSKQKEEGGLTKKKKK
jgi:hypothetical protein